MGGVGSGVHSTKRQRTRYLCQKLRTDMFSNLKLLALCNQHKKTKKNEAAAGFENALYSSVSSAFTGGLWCLKTQRTASVPPKYQKNEAGLVLATNASYGSISPTFKRRR